MTIQFSCPTCGKELKTGDEKAGLSAKCPGCNTVLTVPEPDPSQAEYGEGSATPFDRPVGQSGTQDCPMCGASVAAGATRCPACGEGLVKTTAFVGGPIVYATPLKRFAAAILDGLLINVIAMGIGFGLGFMIAVAQGGEFNEDTERVLGAILNLFSIVGVWLYSALMESSERQATLGKMALGIKVVDASGGRISFGQATGRHFAKILSGCLCLYGYLKILWDPKRQGLHDDLAKTYVVNK